MTKKSHILYAVISLCAVAAYCGFLVKNAITEVDVAEETLPYSVTEAVYPTEEETEPLVEEVMEIETNIPAREPEQPTEKETRLEGFSPLLPVEGEIIQEFSLTHAYNKTTGDWRAHSGIDIKVPVNTPVIAVDDGVVIDVYRDPLFNLSLEIDHGEYVSIYKNIVSVTTEPGKSVRRGEEIATVGNSGALEKLLPPHLHFEIRHFNELVDPSELLG